MRLVKLEFKRILKTLVFWLMTLILIFSIVSQIGGYSNQLQYPQPGRDSYGKKLTTDIEFIFPNLMIDLYRSTETNSFATYPFGFYRQKTLNDEELKLVKSLIEELTKVNYEDLNINKIKELDSSNINQEYLEEKLNIIDSLVGNGSSFAPDNYQYSYGNIGMSYQDAIEEYKMMESAGLDFAFVRYFSDYAGIFILLFGFFLPIAFWGKDLKNGVSQTLFAKSITSPKLVISRVVAMCFAILLPILAAFTYYEINLFLEFPLGSLSIIRSYLLILYWLLPVIIFVVSLGSLLIIAINNIIGGLIGPLLAYLMVFLGSANIYGNYGWGLVIRHNTIGNEQYFIDNFQQLILNRGLWIFISLIILIIAIFILNLRRGGVIGAKSSPHFKNRI